MQLPPNKLHVLVLAALHLASLFAIAYFYLYGISGLELAYHLVAYFLGCLSITLLYHRVWTHNAAALSRPVEYFFATASCFVLQGSALSWIQDHIAHHQHTDTVNDPYNIKQGFWWAHIEWIFYQPQTELRLPVRLSENPVLAWQQKHYIKLILALNVVLPMLFIAPLVAQPWWGILLVSALRLTVCNHIVWCVNSVCHWFGSRPFTQAVSARNVWWFPFTLGEQYHNYHHAFPRDYRNGIRWFDFDPTKWVLALLAKLGLATNLFTMPEERIATARDSVVSIKLALPADTPQPNKAA